MQRNRILFSKESFILCTVQQEYIETVVPYADLMGVLVAIL